MEDQFMRVDQEIVCWTTSQVVPKFCCGRTIGKYHVCPSLGPSKYPHQNLSHVCPSFGPSKYPHQNLSHVCPNPRSIQISSPKSQPCLSIIQSIQISSPKSHPCLSIIRSIQISSQKISTMSVHHWVHSNILIKITAPTIVYVYVFLQIVHMF